MSAWDDYLRRIRMNPNPPPMEQEWSRRGGSWLGNINPALLPNEGQYADLRRRFPGTNYRQTPSFKASGIERGEILENKIWGNDEANRTLGRAESEFLRHAPQLGNLGDADIPMRASSGISGWGETYGLPAVSAQSGPHSKWKKVIEQLGKMTGPEPDWDLAGKRVGPASAWAHTNIPYNPTAGLMGFDLDPEKKKRYA